MLRAAIALTLVIVAGSTHAQMTASCAMVSAPQAAAIGPTVVAPIAPELVAPNNQLGAPSGVLAQALDESLSVDQVLYRIRLAGCQAVASVSPASVPGALPGSAPGTGAMPDSTDPAAYKPRSEFDNGPWRFDMNQNGKRMTADEFDAWMVAKGVRVVRAPLATSTTDPTAAGTTATPAAAPGAKGDQ